MRLAGLTFMATLCAVAHAESTRPYNEKGGQSGTPSTIMVPDYPKAALAANRTGYVDVSGVVDGFRMLGDVRMEPDVPANADMAEALRDVLRYWRFQPPTGEDCAPTSDRITSRVWFEASEGKPHVSVTMLKRPEWKAADPERYKATVQPEPVYPGSAITRGIEAIVYARVDIAPDGHVTEASARAFSRPPNSELVTFQNEVIRRVKQWKFPPLPPAETAVRAVCREFVFSLRD